MFQVCTLERIPYIFLFNDAIDIYIILTESHDQELSNKPIYILRNTLVNEIHVEQSKCPKHLKRFWGHCTTHLEVQEDKLDFQSVTGEVLTLLLICLSLFTYRGDT